MTISNLQRKPSMLSVLEPISETSCSRSVRPPSSSSSSPLERDCAVRQWAKEEVAAWLAEIGMEQYQVSGRKEGDTHSNRLSVLRRVCSKSTEWKVGGACYGCKRLT